MHGPKAYEAVRQRIKEEVENCIDFDAFLVIQSLAGGTGSGLGSFFTERLRKDYPYSTIMNLAIWPYQTGEVVVQNYNIVLSIAHLYKFTDAILLLDNGEFHSICSAQRNAKTVSLQHINTLIADTLVNLFLGVRPLSDPLLNPPPSPPPMASLWMSPIPRDFSFLSRQALLQRRERHVPLRQLLHQLCPLPHYKLLSLKFVPQSSSMSEQFSITNRNGLLRSLSQMALTDRSLDEKLNWSISMKKPYHRQNNPYTFFIGNILILRGKDIILPSSSASTATTLATTSTTTTTTTTTTTATGESFPSQKRVGLCNQRDTTAKNEESDRYDAGDLKPSKDKSRNRLLLANPLALLASQPYFQYDYPPLSGIATTKLYTYYSNDHYKYFQSAYLISNSTAVVSKLEEVIEKVSQMYTTKAYIYQYNKYGLSNEHFERMMLEIEQVLYDYKKLIPSI